MQPVRDGRLASVGVVAVAIVVAVAVLAMVQVSGGFSGPLQATPASLAAAAHPGGQG
jgi:hypothetical protein